MKKTLSISILCGALFAVTQSTGLGADQPASKAGAPATREESVLVTVTASVEAIDQAKREVTLKGPLGNVVTFTVDERVKRLGEVKVGDLVTADYYVSIAAELRKPTAEEEKTPFAVLDAAGKRPPGASPGAGGLKRFKAVTTIEGLDRTTETVTVKGPLGNLWTVRAADPSILPKLRIGEHIIVTYTEALAVTLEKTTRPNPAGAEKAGTKEP